MPHESNKGKNSTIEEIPLNSWEEFEDAIEEEYQSHEELKKSYPRFLTFYLEAKKTLVGHWKQLLRDMLEIKR